MSHSLFSVRPQQSHRSGLILDGSLMGVLFIGLILLFFGCQAPESGPQVASAQSLPAPLLDNLGEHTMPITTTSLKAQQYFDQGLTLAYGFNHAEAGRSFRAARQLDSTCAMCAWGEALVLGPNINAAMDPDDNAPAWRATQGALRLARQPDVTAKEKALIQALSHRYAKTPPEDRSTLDRAYANAMRPVAEQYPDDPDVQALFAEALMNTTPWDYWQEDDTPKPVTDTFTAALDTALHIQPDHPGANHFYIHAVEAVHPERGIPMAERLETLVPGAGHLVHMPSHIYVRVGRYHNAVRTNERAVAADEKYIEKTEAQGFYPLLYYPHNYHFLWFSAMMAGESAVAIEAAEAIQERLTDDMIEVQRLRPTLLFALARFERWDDVRALPKPAEEHLYTTAMWHYGQGLAQLDAQNARAAREHLNALTSIAASEEGQALEQPFFYGLSQINIARHLLQGRLAEVEGNEETMLEHLRTAVQLQDELPYMEPPYWYYPTRHTLGAALLRAGRHAEAEAVYRDDLAHFAENGWALHGLARSLRAQGRQSEAQAVTRRFRDAWTYADVTLAAGTPSPQ